MTRKIKQFEVERDMPQYPIDGDVNAQLLKTFSAILIGRIHGAIVVATVAATIAATIAPTGCGDDRPVYTLCYSFMPFALNNMPPGL